MAPGAVSARVILCHDPLRHSPRLSICSPLKKIFYSQASLERTHFHFHYHFYFPPPGQCSIYFVSIFIKQVSVTFTKNYHHHFLIFENYLRRSGAFSFFVAAILLRLHDRVRRAGGAARPPKFLRRWKLKSVWLGNWIQVWVVKLLSCIDLNKSMSWWVDKVGCNILNVRFNKVKSWSRIQYTMWHDVSQVVASSNDCWLLIQSQKSLMIWITFCKKCFIQFHHLWRMS